MTIKTIAAALVMGCGLCTAADSLSIQLFRTLAKETEGNMAFSPQGVENVLRTLKKYSAGDTAAELGSLPMGKAPAFNINVKQADALFVANNLPLVPGVKDAVSVNFEQSEKAAQTINDWCSTHTNGLIKKLVQANDFSELTAFVATNAIYMKEKWQFPFDPNDSFPGEFTTANGKTVPANMMSCTAKFPAAKGEDWVAVALPYAATAPKGETCYFIAISPTKDIRQFATTLTDKKYSAIINRIAYTGEKTKVIMPSFTVDGSTLNLNNALKAAGLKKIFSYADFSRLTTSKTDLYLSAVLQKCYVKVEEQGTEAAAATAAIANYRSIPRIRTVVLDRPFIWVIGSLSANSTPLFMGIVEQP
ncbi:MAG: serpin family protein [Akkermansia sp.]|nr:serpin family protein [Akkermansia sp.]